MEFFVQNNEATFLDEVKDKLNSHQFKLLVPEEKQKILKKTLRKFNAEFRKSFEELSKSQNGYKAGYFSLVKFSRRFGIKVNDIKSQLSDFDHAVVNDFIYINKKQNEHLISSFKEPNEAKNIVEKSSIFENCKRYFLS
jgi:hypothetical protein